MRFDVLSRHLEVFEPHFLEASAGTGKTFAIEHLVTRLLIEGSSPLKIEQILVVTFTRAATRELKLRIRRNLGKTKEELNSGTPSVDYLQAICEQGEAAVKTAIERIDAALICYDAAQIFTLHGFCHRVLGEFAFEAGIGMGVSDPDEKQHVALLEQMVRDHLKEDVSAPDYSPFQIKAVLGRNKNDPRRLIANLVKLISNGREIAEAPTHGQALEAFRKELEALPSVDAGSFTADLLVLRSLYNKLTGDHIPGQFAFLAEILATKSCSAEQFDVLLRKEFFLEIMGEENAKKRAKAPDLSSLHYPGLLERVRRALLPSIESAKDSDRIFLRLGRDLQKKSQALLEQQEKFSPDALLLKVEEALKMPRFVERVRHKYRAAIIDEFQDTDPVQWNIFQKLFLSHIDAICLVGDPKQSIYAFRNADVYVYLDAANAMGSSAKKYLDTNFRSTGALVEALNLLFSRAQGGWMDLPGRDAPLEVIPVKAGARQKAGEAEIPVQFFIATGRKGKSKKFPTEEMFDRKVLPYIASEIFSLHTQKEVEYHDIAILIKDRYQGKAVIDYLKGQGIPASFKRGASITESISYFALKEMLAAVLSPGDISKVKAALGGPLIYWSEQQLNKGLEDSSLLQAKAQMQALSNTLYELGVGSFFQALLHCKWGGSETLLQEMLKRGDLPLYLDLRKLSELLIEEETLSGLKGDAFLRFLEEIGIDDQGDESRLKVPPEEEKGSVAVMSIHMSKGLEFDTVFALGVAARHKPSEQIVVKKDGRSVMTLLDPADSACQRAIAESDAEKMRQLYVALTRAKSRLYIPLMIEEEGKGISIGEASPIELFLARIAERTDTHASLYETASNIDLPRACELLGGLSPLISTCILEEVGDLQLATHQHSEIALEPPPSFCMPNWDEQVVSFSALAKKDHATETVKPSEGAALSPHTMPLGSETGHLLHLLFEKIFKRGLHHPLNEKALAELIEEEIAFSSLENWRPILLPWIVGLLKKPLTTFCLCDVPRHQLQQEMEFYYPIDRGAMKGFSDLFFEFEGKYYILDWKSNYLGPSDADYTPEKIADVMRQHQYDMQASIYADALRRYVKLFDTRPFSECFGGAIYYFVRGNAVYHFIPEAYA
ncbi:MAG: UvrD-helicase domain-containing protein [Verrucomicrobia bacterium]|nr:UvrD-helicase domain-containing protein [Verrucomicrobiota bacterium]